MGQTELAAKVRELKELRQLAAELDEQIVSIEDAIKGEMTAQGVDTLMTGLFKVTWKPVVSQRFDTSGFKAKYGDLYAQFSKPVETRRFSVA